MTHAIFFTRSNTPIIVDYKTNNDDKSIPQGDTWAIKYGCYICSIEDEDAHVDTTTFIISTVANGNSGIAITLDHIIEDADRRSLVDTDDLKKHMSTSWARHTTKVTVGDEFQITVDQLRPDRVEMRIQTQTLNQICKASDIKPTDLIRRTLEVPAVDHKTDQLMYTESKLHPRLNGACFNNCGLFHAKWAIEKFGEDMSTSRDEK